jgi:SAM-dependent methyltransferase
MRDEDLSGTRRRYAERYATYGYDPRTLGWNKGRQRVRFAAATEGLRPEDCGSVLDVGCGFGDLYAFLRADGWQGKYLGLDIVPELLQEARNRFGDGADFAELDLTRERPEGSWDLAVALGIFNHSLGPHHIDFVNAMLEAMWESTTRVVVLDFLSTSAEQRRKDLFYADPAKIYGLASRFSRRVAIHHAYMPFEFQIKIWHEDSFDATCPIFPPYKRFTDPPRDDTTDSA